MNFTKREVLKQKPTGTLGFGKYFTDYMFKMDYDPQNGWHNDRIEPYAPFLCDPAMTVFHYAQEIFEGMKAFYNKDGEITVFRPDQNFARMNRSCDRMCIPELPVDTVMNGLFELLKIEKDWIPKDKGTALYIRPTLIATDAMLGVHASKTYLFYIILSPVGAYYASGLAPAKIYVEDEYVRAAHGGTGEAKCGGNYAGSMIAGTKAEKEGFVQVLWLDAKENKYIEEVGAMNMFFVFGDEVVTPVLNGSILPGITRKSILELAKDFGYKTSERRISIDEVVEGLKSGAITEAFGTGTAAVVSPVGLIRYKDADYVINNNEIGEKTMRLYDKLTGIQTGRYPDTKGWVKIVK